MADWTHPICERCWIERHTTVLSDGLEIRKPVRVKVTAEQLREFQGDDALEMTAEECCFCGGITIVGIYVRYDPMSMEVRCKGVHESLEVGDG